MTPLTASSGENADTLSAQWIINNNDSQAWQTIDVTHKCDCFFTTGMKLAEYHMIIAVSLLYFGLIVLSFHVSASIKMMFQ